MHRKLARVAALLLLAGCTKIGTADSNGAAAGVSGGRHAWTRPGILRIGVQQTPNTLNPLLASNTTESMISRLMFDVLVTVDATGRRAIPVLAAEVPTLENGGISPDGLAIRYKLRRNVRWHDGVPFTSEDVAFSWREIMNRSNNVISRTGYELVRSVDTPDPYTVVFHMKQRFVPVVNTLFAESDEPFEVVPEHVLAKYPNFNNVPFNSLPVGTGPFKLKEWARGDHVTLVANDAYFLGRPHLAQIVLKIVPDENTEVNQLRTHELDWQFEASPEEYETLKTLPGLKILLQEKNDYERIQVNTRHAPLDDANVRRAIAYSLDTRKLVDDLTYGSAEIADQDLPPFMWAHADRVTRYPYDPARAKALLQAAGWTPGPDGILLKGGRRLSLELVTNTANATRRRGVVEAQSMLHAVGIDISIKQYLGQLLFAPMGSNGVLQNGRFDLAWTGWVAGIDPDQSSLFLCSAQPPNGNNETHYCTPQMDAAEEDALTHFEIPARRAAYAQIEAMLTRDVPQIPVWWPRQIQPYNPDFRNFAPNPVTESWNAYQWEI